MTYQDFIRYCKQLGSFCYTEHVTVKYKHHVNEMYEIALLIT